MARTPSQFNLFHARGLPSSIENTQSPDGLPPCLDASFKRQTRRRRACVGMAPNPPPPPAPPYSRSSSAPPGRGLTPSSIHGAARETGVCEETIRRAVREGRIADRRANPKGRHRVRRGDLQRIAGGTSPPYDPIADAQSIAQLRRKL